MSTGKQSAGRRLRVITIDQAIAGASNVLIAVLAARLLDVSSFGLFGIIFLVDVMAQGVARALVCDPVLVHPVEAQERPGEAIGTAVLLGAGLGALVLLAGLVVSVWNNHFGTGLIVLAFCLPLLVLQDLGRYLGFAIQRPIRAVVLDVAWLVLLIAIVAVLFATDTRTLAAFIAAWGGSGAAAGLILFAQYRGREIRLNFAWLRHTWDFSWRYVISYTSTQGSALGISSGVGAIAGSRALGGFQGALLLVRPFMTFQVAAIAATVSEIARSVNRLRRHVVRATALTTAAAAVNLTVMLIVPDRLGRVVLGASWHAAKPLLLPTGIQIVLMGLITGSRGGLLGMREIRKVMAIDATGAAGLLIASIAGASINGAKGALWVADAWVACQTVAWWLVFMRHVRDTARAPVPSVAPAVIPPVPAPSQPSA